MKQKINLRGLGFRPDLRLAAHKGIKTRTRRTIARVPWEAEFDKFLPETGQYRFANNETVKLLRCPYGLVGDYLYVKEPWGVIRTKEGFFYKYSETVEGLPELMPCNHPRREELSARISYSAQMLFPKEAARSFFKLTSVGVEKAHDISYFECVREGVKQIDDNHWFNYLNELRREPDLEDLPSPKDSFISLWQRINGVESWASNPLVWVLGFEKSEIPCT